MLCPKHQTQYNKWLDYQAPITGWMHTTGNNLARSTYLSLETHKARSANRRALIRNQLNGIKTDCKTQCQETP